MVREVKLCPWKGCPFSSNGPTVTLLVSENLKAGYWVWQFRIGLIWSSRIFLWSMFCAAMHFVCLFHCDITNSLRWHIFWRAACFQVSSLSVLLSFSSVMWPRPRQWLLALVCHLLRFYGFIVDFSHCYLWFFNWGPLASFCEANPTVWTSITEHWFPYMYDFLYI